MVRRGGDADASGEGTSWLVLRHVQAEGLGLLTNVLRDRGIHHRYLDLPRGEAPPRDLTNVGRMVLSELCPVVQARQAEFYVLDSSEEKTHLKLLASYASESSIQEPGKRI